MINLNSNYSKYPDFKPFSYYKKANEPIQKKKNYKPLIGASIGAASSFLFFNKMLKGKELNGFQSAAKMIAMAASANTGGVIGGSIGADKKSVKKKLKEAAFQMMNMALPMILVSSFLEICKRSKKLPEKFIKPTKITGSIAAMITGAYLATQITNQIKQEGENKRKYTIKDSIANFDDVVATIAIGFPEVLKIVPVDNILPFIYAYCGKRAGEKE